jgi:predicted GNAT family acetyltransferase
VTSTNGDPEVIEVPGEHRFVFRDQGATAELIYQVVGGKLVLVHTGVPAELGGRGIGGQLVRAALDKAEREHLTVVPYCPFARRWLRDHPDETALATIDWQPMRRVPPR